MIKKNDILINYRIFIVIVKHVRDRIRLNDPDQPVFDIYCAGGLSLE
jgi:hypothetical protein